MRRRALVVLAAAGLLAAVAPAVRAQALPTHPSQLPPLTPDGPYPRCTAAELASAGFPDHQHAWSWPGWQPPVGDDGLAYGPGTFCRGKSVEPRPGLVVGESEQRYGPWIIRHNPAYAPCDMLGFLEVLDYAQRSVTALTGLAPADTLVIVNPDNSQAFSQLGGAGTWRPFRREGAQALLQPVGTLQARTLDGHAAFQLAADWTLTSALPTALPAWLRWGLAEYLAEDGVHLVNYVNEFRPQGSPLYRPAIAEAILAGPPDNDPGRDRERFRRASYTAFLMAWELVENRGGLPALRRFLQEVKGGTPLDEASRRVYGQDMTGLARSLDPVELGEPLGEATQSRRPDRQP